MIVFIFWNIFYGDWRDDWLVVDLINRCEECFLVEYVVIVFFFYVKVNSLLIIVGVFNKISMFNMLDII